MIETNIKAPNSYSDFLIDPSFQGVNRLFLFYRLKIRTIGQFTQDIIFQKSLNFFEQSVKSNLRTYDYIRNIAAGQGDGYMTGCLLDYNYFNNYYKVMAIDLRKQQALDADPKAIQ